MEHRASEKIRQSLPLRFACRSGGYLRARPEDLEELLRFESIPVQLLLLDSRQSGRDAPEQFLDPLLVEMSPTPRKQGINRAATERNDLNDRPQPGLFFIPSQRPVYGVRCR